MANVACLDHPRGPASKGNFTPAGGEAGPCDVWRLDFTARDVSVPEIAPSPRARLQDLTKGGAVGAGPAGEHVRTLPRGGSWRGRTSCRWASLVHNES